MNIKRHPETHFMRGFENLSEAQEAVKEYFGFKEEVKGSIVDACWAYWYAVPGGVYYAESIEKLFANDADCFFDETPKAFDAITGYPEYSAAFLTKGEILILSTRKRYPR